MPRNKKKHRGTLASLDEDNTYDYEADDLGVLDDDLDWMRGDNNNTLQMPPSDQKTFQANEANGECGICCETKPLLNFMKKCRQYHANACYDCLRQQYIVQAQKSSENYPLKCWHPSCCGRLVQNEQIKQLAQTEEEMNQHYRLSVMAQAQNRGKMVVHCNNCDYPRAITIRQPRQDALAAARQYVCLQCREPIQVDETQETGWRMLHVFGGAAGLREVVNLLETTLENDWALCPGCNIIVSKVDGCDHMECPCGRAFQFDRASRAAKALLETLLPDRT